MQTIDLLEIAALERCGKLFLEHAKKARKELAEATTVLDVRGRQVFVIDPDKAPLEWRIQFFESLGAEFIRKAARMRRDLNQQQKENAE